MGRASTSRRRSKWKYVALFSFVAVLCWGYPACFPQGMGGSHRVPPPKNPRNNPIVNSNIFLSDIAAEAGLTFKHESGDPINKKFLLESIGSGVAIFDYDGDGLQDIFLVSATPWNSVATKSKP